MGVIDELHRGRASYDSRSWADAVDALGAADRRDPLEPADLELLATAQFMVGHDEDYFATLERAHHGHAERGATRRAVACAFWIGMPLLMRGEIGRGGGWLGRAHRLLERVEGDCPERGYLLMPEMFRKEAAGEAEDAVATAAAAAEAGQRFGDADLTALALFSQGQLLVRLGRLSEGLRLLDEAMLAVAGGEVSPIPTGIVYCGAIGGCQLAFDPRRAAEWTAALHAWCELQPDMLAFTGDCLVHRAEIMLLQGEWAEALEELDRATQRATRAGNARVLAQAAYCRGEVLRLRGAVGEAEEAYRDAGRGGREPQPGLALLRLAQGDASAAGAAMRRVLSETNEAARRAALLPAYVEVMLAAEDLEAARQACEELERIAAERPSDMLAASAQHMRGAIELAAGDARGALPSLRRALAGWCEIGAPHEAARVRLLVAEACATLGDQDSAAMEREAACEAIEKLGAVLPSGRPQDAYGLSARELQVLRLVAAGETNRQIASQLVLSERTVDRHVSNIFAKLRVSSRAAATAVAYEHRLL